PSARGVLSVLPRDVAIACATGIGLGGVGLGTAFALHARADEPTWIVVSLLPLSLVIVGVLYLVLARARRARASDWLALGDTAPEDIRLQGVDVAPVLDLRLGAARRDGPRGPGSEVHAQEGGVRHEVVDIERAQRVERLGRRRLAPRHLAGQLEQLPPALLEDGAVECRLAREYGVDGPHREPGQARDVLQLGRREAALGEHLLRGLDDVA